MMYFSSGESRQPESTRGKRADIGDVWQEEMSAVSGKENRKRYVLWIVILILALVALILTIIFGYYSLGSSDTILR